MHTLRDWRLRAARLEPELPARVNVRNKANRRAGERGEWQPQMNVMDADNGGVRPHTEPQSHKGYNGSL